jgi:hypothetical protein
VSEFEGLLPPGEVAERKAVEAEAVRIGAVRRRWSRSEAVAHGRALGEDTAVQKGEVGLARDQRVARAQAYAAWEWDGKPTGGAHLVEFGVVSPDVKSHARVFRGPDMKGGRK